MFPVTQTFLDTVRSGGFVRATTVDVYFQGVYQTTLPIADGTVSINRTADIRRSVTLTVADESFVPNFVNSPLAPYGAELVIKSGIVYEDGSIEYADLGVFRIEQVTWEESAGSLPKVTAYDRTKVLSDANFLVPLGWAGVGIFDLMTRLVQDVCDCNVNIDDINLTDQILPGGTTFQSDRVGALSTCAQAIGAESFFDVHGNYVVQPISALTQAAVNSLTPDWDVNVGPSGILVQANRGVSRTGVANAISVTGSASGTGASPMGWAADTDPRSPTYWGPIDHLPYGPWKPDVFGPFGQVVKNVNNQLCTTQQQCITAAQAELKKTLGLARSLDFTAVWNPALQDGDVVRLTYLDGTTELHTIDELTIPIGNSNAAMTASTRTLTYQLTANT